MALRNFGLGFPPLDDYISGLHGGESILLVHSHPELWDLLVEHIIRGPGAEPRKLAFISARTEPQSILDLGKRSLRLHLRPAPGQKGKIGISDLFDFLKSTHRDSIILIDDFSEILSILPQNQQFGKFFAAIQNVLQKKNSVIVSAINKGAASVESLIASKDAFDISLELILHEKDLYFSPLNGRRRWLGGGNRPLKVSLQTLRKKSPPSGEMRASEQAPATGLMEELRFDEMYAELFARSPFPIAILGTTGDFRDFNEKCVGLLGYSKDELRVSNLIGLVDSGDRIKALRLAAEIRRRHRVSDRMHLKSRSGKSIPVEINMFSTGNGYYVAQVHDRSEIVARESLLVRDLNEANDRLAKASIYSLVFRDGKMSHCGSATPELFGASGSDELLTKPWKSLFDPDSARKLQKAISESLQGGDSTIDVTGRKLNGENLSLNLRCTRILVQQKPAVLVSMQNLTPVTSLVTRLTETESRFRLLLERLDRPVTILADDALVYANPASCAFYGFETLGEFQQQPFTALLAESNRERFTQTMKKVQSGKQQTAVLQLRAMKKGGAEFDLHLTLAYPAAVVRGGVVLYHEDITAQKATAGELDQLKQEFAQLDDFALTLKASGDGSRALEHLLSKVMHILRLEAGALFLPAQKGKVLTLRHATNFPVPVSEKLGDISTEEGLGGLVAKMLSPHYFTIDRYPSYLPHKVLFRDQKFSAVCLLPLTNGGKLAGLMLLATRKDVTVPGTEFLAALGTISGMIASNVDEFQRVAEAERNFHMLVDGIRDTVYRSSSDGKMLYVSPQIEELTGYKARDFYTNKSLWLSLVHPDDKKVLLQRMTEDTSGREGTTEYRFLPKGKATYRWVRDAVTFIKNQDGMIDGVLGIMTDVTPSRQAIHDLSRSSVLRGSILASMKEGVMVTDRSFRIIEWNGMMEEITGLHSADVVGKSFETVFPSEGQQNFQKLLRRALEGEYVRSEEFRPVLPDSDREIYLWGSFSPLMGEGEAIEGVVGVVTDISERKQLERELRESEQVLRNVIDTMSDILLITDLKGRVLQVNRTFLQNIGYTRQECIGQEFPYPWVLEEEMGRFVLWIANLREKNWLHDFDMTWRTKDGDLISMSLSTTLLRNSYGEPIAMLNIARDITERRRLMKELQHRNRQVELINRIISAANQTMDFNLIFEKIAAEIRETVPCDDMNIAVLNPAGKSHAVLASLKTSTRYAGDHVAIERTAAQYAIASQQPVIIPDLAAEAAYEGLFSFQEGMRSEMSIPIVVKGNVLGTFNLLSYEPHTYHEDHASTLVPVVQQIGVIIDRVRLFRQVSDDATYIHKLLDSIDSVVYTVDTDCRIREVNNAWYEFVRSCGIQDGPEYHGMDVMEAIPIESLKIVLQGVVGDLLSGAVRSFAQEFVHTTPDGERIFQLTINPMVIDARVIGLVISHTDITALKQTEHELKRNYEQLLALNQISTLISTSLNLDDILQGTVPLLSSTFGASGVLVYLREREGEGLNLVQKEGLPDIMPEQIRYLPEQETVTGYVVTTKEPVYIIEDAVDDDRLFDGNRPLLRKAGIVSLAAIPLMSKDKVHGALDMMFNSRQDFPSHVRQMLTLIGNQLGAAIENALLYQELLSQIARLTVLYELSQQLTSTLESHQIFQIIYEHVARVIHYARMQVGLIDERRQIVTHSMVADRIGGAFTESFEPGTAVRISHESPEHWVLEHRAINVNSDSTMIFLPMYSKGTIMGIMSASTDPENAFSGIQLRLFESIGNLAAIAFEKAMLYEETVQKSREIERRNKELDDFTYVVSHDLKEPLISIEGFGKILQLDYQETIGKEGKEYLDSILGASTRMKGLIDDLLMLSRVSRPSEAFRPVSTKKVVDEIRSDLEFSFRQKGAKLVAPDDLPVVFGNETHVKVVFQNLIGNALKFNATEHPLVEIGFQNAENNYYLFSVQDNGIGISSEFFEKIFVIFQRLHRREDYEGSGAGLAIVKKIIEMHKGNIWVKSDIGKGSTFFFTLPKVESES